MTWKWKITINWVTLLLTFIGCTFPIGIRAIMGKLFFIFHSTPISLWSSGTMRGDKYNQQLQWHRTRMDLPLRIITIITHMWVHNSLLNWQVRETYSCNDSLFTCCSLWLLLYNYLSLFIWAMEVMLKWKRIKSQSVWLNDAKCRSILKLIYSIKLIIGSRLPHPFIPSHPLTNNRLIEDSAEV